jgi:hypothetical protein
VRGPKISILPRHNVPVELETVRIIAKDGVWSVEGLVTNAADAALVRVETILLVDDATGRHLDQQIDELTPDVVPLPPHAARAFTVPMRTAPGDGDHFRLGVRAAETTTDIWTDDRLTAQVDSAAGGPQARDPGPSQEAVVDAQAPIVLNREDAPAAIIDVSVVRGITGTPTAVHVVLRNNLPEPLGRVKVDVLVFTGRGGLRAQSFMPVTHPVPGSGTVAVNVIVNQPFGGKDWQLVVAVSEAETPTGHWTYEHLREVAQASLPPRH